jgi:hypothetical protein
VDRRRRRPRQLGRRGPVHLSKASRTDPYPGGLTEVYASPQVERREGTA